MKRWVASVVAAAQPFVFGTLMGWDYSHLGFTLAASYVMALYLFFVAAFIPNWK